MRNDIFRIREGMEVFGPNGQKVGKVGKVVYGGASREARFFTIEKGLIFHKDYLVPREAIERVEGQEQAHIRLTKDQVEKLPEYQGRPPSQDDVRKAYENLGGRRTEGYSLNNVGGQTERPTWIYVEEYRILSPEERQREGYRDEWSYGDR